MTAQTKQQPHVHVVRKVIPKNQAPNNVEVLMKATRPFIREAVDITFLPKGIDVDCLLCSDYTIRVELCRYSNQKQGPQAVHITGRPGAASVGIEKNETIDQLLQHQEKRELRQRLLESPDEATKQYRLYCIHSITEAYEAILLRQLDILKCNSPRNSSNIEYFIEIVMEVRRGLLFKTAVTETSQSDQYRKKLG